LKWGLSPRAASNISPCARRDIAWMAWMSNGVDAETGSWANHRRATAFERTCGSAGGKNPGG
jgi:hypothetical protein